MIITDKDTLTEKVRDVALTVAAVGGAVLLIAAIPKILKHIDISTGLTASMASLNAANAVRALSLAKTYDIRSAKDAMMSLPAISGVR